MSDPQSQHDGGARPAQRPYWKRMHHSPFFWVAAFFILLAMVIYVTSENLSLRPGRPAQAPVPAIAP